MRPQDVVCNLQLAYNILRLRAYTDQLYRTSLGLGFDDSAARELVQTTWATFAEAVGKFEGRSHIRTYLFGILYNKASEARREHARFDVSYPVEELIEKRFDTYGGQLILMA